MKEPEVPIEGPWQARAGGSVEAAVEESSGMSAATAGIPPGLAAGHPNENNSFQEIDEALAAGHDEAGSHSGDSGDDGSYAGDSAW